MRFRILSWNVRGFSHPHLKFKVKDTLAKWKPDVLLLQEVKIGNERLDMSLFNLWKDALFVHTLHNEGSGGAVLGLSPSISKFVIDKGEDPSHYCVWALTLINGQPLGFCSIYAPNNPRERVALWDWMSKNLPIADWVLGGDFNMVEHHEDRSWSSHLKLSQEEFEKWIFCRNVLGVVDPIHNKFSCHAKNWFTWSNCRPSNERKLSRLDHFYLSHNLRLEKMSQDF